MASMIGALWIGCLRVVGAFLFMIAVTACTSSRGSDIPYDVAGFGEPDAPSATRLASDYRIAPLDKLSINVFQVKDLSGEYQVDLTGNIAMPLIGNIPAVDRTTQELQEELKVALSKKYLKDPDVTVGILEATGSTLTLEGSINKPGLYPAFGKLTLVQAVAMGGGLDEFANPKTVVVFRQVDGKRMAAAFDLTTIRKGEDPDPEVYRGDIIVVDGSNTKRAWRNVIQSVPLLGLFRPI
ncbi:polysaccharide biosynthesis/export family protein [Altererythrobacter sp. GH1-8]|uniref:polysaccharide biosynthesis/export family protein n=1 Tax=Altererythrobacter sp. GH1-8 TaxID=3349333 RepID=UPI00374CD459